MWIGSHHPLFALGGMKKIWSNYQRLKDSAPLLAWHWAEAKSNVHQELCLNLCWKQTKRWVTQNVKEGQVDCGTRRHLWYTHTRPRLALNLFVRELSKWHDSCECTISSLLERAPPCHVQWAGWSAILFLFWFYLFFFFTILGLFLGNWLTEWISLCALFSSSFWPWKLVALTSPVYNIRDSSLAQWEPSLIFQTQGLCQYAQLPFVCMRVCI